MNSIQLDHLKEETRLYLERMKAHEKVPVGGEKTSM